MYTEGNVLPEGGADALGAGESLHPARSQKMETASATIFHMASNA